MKTKELYERFVKWVEDDTTKKISSTKKRPKFLYSDMGKVPEEFNDQLNKVKA